MPTSPADDLRAWLTGWAAAQTSAIEALVAWSGPRLRAALPAHTASEIADATRRVLHTTPPFAVADPDRLLALLTRLVTHELAAGRPDDGGAGAPASPRPLPALTARVALDLDRGRSDGTRDQDNALRKLAVLLLPPRDRKLLLAAWTENDDAALGARFGMRGDFVARERSRCEQTLRTVAEHLGLGAVASALAAAAPDTDPWGSATQWSVVLGAVSDDRNRQQDSWRRLVERYETPIRCAIRRAQAVGGAGEDLTADFFSYLYEHDVLGKAHPHGGRFRAYIQAVLRNFLHRQRRRGRPMVELDEACVPVTAPADDAVERTDELEWAQHVLHLALAGLHGERARDAEILVRYYGLACPDGSQPRPAESREALAAHFGVSMAAIDQATYRARRALRAHLERELRETVDGADAMRAEVELVVGRLLQAHPGLL